MQKKVMFIVAGGLVLLLVGLCGWAVASDQQAKRFPFLSELYNAKYIPTFAEWNVLDFTASYNNRGYLTDKLIRQSCVAYLHKDKLMLSVGTSTQPAWDVYLGNGRFSVSDRELRATYAEAAAVILNSIRLTFPEDESGLSDQELHISFFIRGSEVGVWHGGIFKLVGE